MMKPSWDMDELIAYFAMLPHEMARVELVFKDVPEALPAVF